MNVANRRKQDPAVNKTPINASPQSLIGRQPILDRDGTVQAYELLFRPDTSAADSPFDGNRATANVIMNAMIEFDLDHLVGDHRAYINFTAEMLQNDAVLLLPKERVVIEILEDVAIDDALVAAVTKLARSGYELALDDFIYSPQWQPLIDLATTIKIDVLALDSAQVEAQVEILRPHKVTLLAEKVETVEQHALLLDLGFDLFQGFYYAKPNVISRDRIPDDHVAVVHLLAALNDSSATIEDIDALVSADVSLSYRLLRYFNSAFFALPQKVDSIRRALIFFGVDLLRQWVSLLVMANISTKPKVLMQNALVRARMCAELAKLMNRPDPDSYFTVGLFSVLDALLDTPMAVIVESLPLSVEIVDALVNHSGDRGAALCCVCAYERGQWAKVAYAGVDRAVIGQAYLRSIEWAFDAASGL